LASCLLLFPLCSSSFFFYCHPTHRYLLSFPTRRSSDLLKWTRAAYAQRAPECSCEVRMPCSSSNHASTISARWSPKRGSRTSTRSEEHTSELQSLTNLVCRLLLEKKKKKSIDTVVPAKT